MHFLGKPYARVLHRVTLCKHNERPTMYRLPFLLFALVACDAETPVETGDTATVDVAGSCLYVNSFSQAEECKEYLGTGWTLDSMESDCAAPLPGATGGILEEGAACDRSSYLAECFIDADSDEASILVFPGQAGDSCGGLAIGCSFAGRGSGAHGLRLPAL